jgi:hypothetical protein
MKTIWLRDVGEIAFGRVELLYTRGIDVPDAGAPSAGGWSPLAPAGIPSDWTSAPKTIVYAWAPPRAEWLWIATNSTSDTPGLWRLRLMPAGEVDIQSGITADVCNAFGCRQMTSIHGSSPSDLWAVGLNGITFHITDAQGDSPVVTGLNSQTWDALRGVWAASETEAWAVGARGTIRHYTGDPLFWDVVADVPSAQNLNAVWGTSPSDVWAVGDDAVILHYDGTTWSRAKIAGLSRRVDLTTVWSPGPGHVWVGGDGVVLSLGGKP